MSTADEVSKMIEHLYTMDRILLAMQKKPHDYGGVFLHANEAHTLKAIAQHEGISQTELSDQMLRTKGATSVVVDKLVEKGLVTRSRVEGDQRRYLLALTEKGWSVHQAHIEYDERHAHMAAREVGLTTEELETANRALERVTRFYAKNYLEHGSPVTPETE